MQSTLDAFRETESQDSFSLQNNKLLKVELNQVTIQAKLGSMVAYQGDVRFEHAGSGGMGRLLKKAVTGEGTRLMKMEGTGEVFLADQAQDIHLLKLELKKAATIFEEISKKEPENEMAKTLLGLSLSLNPQELVNGEKTLKEITSHSKDPQMKTLADTALAFVNKFVKKNPTPTQGKK